MISDIDAALRKLIGSQTFNGETLKVDLDPPTKDWAARRSGPVLNLFLTDIREDTTRRTANYLEVYNDDGVQIGRRPAERTFMFSYSLSAWTSRPEDDHELLSAALVALLQYDYIPEEFVGGLLALATDRKNPAILRVGGILFSDRLVTELWSAIGGEFRPVIVVTVSVDIPAGMTDGSGPPQTEPPRFTFTNTRTGQTSTVLGPPPAKSAAEVTAESATADASDAPDDSSDAGTPAPRRRQRGGLSLGNQ